MTVDIETAQRLLRNPRELTREEWTQAYLAIQEHTIRGDKKPSAPHPEEIASGTTGVTGSPERGTKIPPDG